MIKDNELKDLELRLYRECQRRLKLIKEYLVKQTDKYLKDEWEKAGKNPEELNKNLGRIVLQESCEKELSAEVQPLKERVEKLEAMIFRLTTVNAELDQDKRALLRMLDIMEREQRREFPGRLL